MRKTIVISTKLNSLSCKPASTYRMPLRACFTMFCRTHTIHLLQCLSLSLSLSFCLPHSSHCALCLTLTPRVRVRHSLNYTSFVWVLIETTAAWTILNASPSTSFIRLSRPWRRKRFNARSVVSLLYISVSATFFRHTSTSLHQKRFVNRCDRTHNPRQLFFSLRPFRFCPTQC